MSHIKSRVDTYVFNWKTIPRGSEGYAQVEISPGEKIEVNWRRDANGLWVLLPNGLYGFDLNGTKDEGNPICYEVFQRGTALQWSDACPSYGDQPALAIGNTSKGKAIRVRAQMPGKIIRILTEVGSIVTKDQPLMVMEAMKMENEIRATQNGKVSQIKVSSGQAVETGADLLLIESE